MSTRKLTKIVQLLLFAPHSPTLPTLGHAHYSLHSVLLCFVTRSSYAFKVNQT